MRHIIKLHLLGSNSSYKLYSSQLSIHQSFCLSSFSKSSKLSHKQSQKTELQGQSEISTTVTINSLFKEITEILGADNFIPDKHPSGFLISKENHQKHDELNAELKTGTRGIYKNVEPNNVLREEEVFLGLDDTQIRDLNEIDVSPVVREITGIVRAENDLVAMEERLENLGFYFEPEIVEKVLKRCFKVPHLAFRFFSWVKMRDGFCHTTKTYYTMLYIAGEAKEFKVVDDLVEEMEKNSCEKDIKTWSILISQFGKAKLIGKALLFFEKMKTSGCEPDEKIYKMMVHSLCNAGKGEVALAFYKEMVQKDMRLDLSLYKILLISMAKSGDVGAVHLVANDMSRLSQIPEHDVNVCILKSFCVAGKIREALELIRDLKNKDILIDYEYLGTLVKGLCRGDRITDAVEIVEIMKKRNLIDAKIYGIIINGYLRKKDLSKAIELFQRMKESGIQPITSTYTELMQCLFNLNQYDKGFELFNEMLERGIRVDSVATMAIVAAHVRQNHISEAWEVFNTMKDKGANPTWKSYSIFIKELCRVSRTDEILKVLYKMQASKIFINNDIFNLAIAFMEKKGEVDNVQKVKQMQRICRLHSLQDEGSGEQELLVEQNCNQSEQGKWNCHLTKPHSMSNNETNSEQGLTNCQLAKPHPKSSNEQDLKEICKILSSSKDWCIMQEALEKCTLQFTPGLVLEILHNCSMHGNAALKFFSWLGVQTGYCHTKETYNMAMKISGREKDFKHMRSLFYEMRRKGCLITPDTWAIMIMQYGRTGLTEISLKTFTEMKDNGYIPNDSTYKYLLISLCGKKGRKVDEAIKIFHEMIRTRYIPDREVVGTYLSCLCEAGRLSEARKSTDSLCRIGYTIPLSYSLYIRALCRSGRLEEALSLLDEVGTERSTLDQYTYGTLVHGLLRKGRQEEALAKIESMKEAGINPTVHVYTSLIVHFFKEKQIEKAMQIFEKMQQDGCEPTVVTYSALIRGYMNMERADDAWSVLNHLKLKGPKPDFKTYSMFISCLCKAGKSEEALQLLSRMLEDGIVPSTINFRTVFFGLNCEGKNDLARTVMQQKLALKSKRKFLT
ncbi:putative pentatricopeptide repeat-containing protein At5g06400, mitochondrial [Ricinus communis]|uniref:Pentatricopeptide repeat-containing protein, putative n=1 Tax=Ricinus communis TaxID=3988 RepID=B9SDM0_RICCO|nr:putative pentatricopeptide repeat-containing protein At5g06400, mitochondrial [Ricinus communis]EEF38299.1 pentatricopeptide repeat-containing protein, putative [Ricinus communis]|eukprot:XP_002524089.1 putative pentatricopeptide repeat-containing protein At5g06400, mitochondrial [Ricinus communis]